MLPRRLVIALFSLALFGCEVAGGGGSRHEPPKYIDAGRDIRLELELSVWGAGTSEITERYKSPKCHYKRGGDVDYETQDMILINQDERRGTYVCVIPAGTFKKGEKVEYYFDYQFDGAYGRRDVDKSLEPE